MDLRPSDVWTSERDVLHDGWRISQRCRYCNSLPSLPAGQAGGGVPPTNQRHRRTLQAIRVAVGCLTEARRYGCTHCIFPRAASTRHHHLPKKPFGQPTPGRWSAFTANAYNYRIDTLYLPSTYQVVVKWGKKVLSNFITRISGQRVSGRSAEVPAASVIRSATWTHGRIYNCTKGNADLHVHVKHY